MKKREENFVNINEDDSCDSSNQIIKSKNNDSSFIKNSNNYYSKSLIAAIEILKAIDEYQWEVDNEKLKKDFLARSRELYKFRKQTLNNRDYLFEKLYLECKNSENDLTEGSSEKSEIINYIKKRFIEGSLTLTDILSAKNKKAISLSLAFALFSAQTPVMAETSVKKIQPIVENVQVFDDIPESHWAFDIISKLQGAGVIEERVNGKFNPNEFITRQDFVRYLMITLGESSSKTVGSYIEKVYDDSGKFQTEKNLNGFWDIWKFSDYHQYIAAAVENGIVNGISAEYFDPEGIITREQLAVILVNTLETYYEGTIYSDEQTFADGSDISSWAKDAINTAVTMGILNGKPNNIFDPKAPLTNVEAMTAIKNIVEFVKQVEFVKPSVNYNYKTIAERLEAAGAKFSDWYYGTGFLRDDKEVVVDGITLRLSGMGGDLGFDEGMYAAIAEPLTGTEEWSEWMTYKTESEEETPLDFYDNGSIEELNAKGIIEAEFKNGVIFEGYSFEEACIMVRIKDNVRLAPLWRKYTYQKRDILNLKEVLDNNQTLLDDLSYLQPVKNIYDGSEQQIEPIPKPYVLEIK